jgi:hypothetical protein
MFHVEINKEEQGFIRIARHSREIMYWELSEWEADPELVFKIAEYIKLALTDPVYFNTMLIQMGKTKPYDKKNPS